MNFRLAVFATAGLLLTAPAFAQVDMPSWDANGDNRITLAEWDTAIEMANVFDNLDRNGNELFDVDEAELPHFSFNVGMDVDKGGRVEREEFIYATFDRLDEDQNGYLDRGEFTKFSEYAEDSDLFD